MTDVPVYERTEARRYLFAMPDHERELRTQIARDVWAQCILSGHAKRPRQKRIPCSEHEGACRTILGMVPLSSLETRTLWRHQKSGHLDCFPTPASAASSFEDFVQAHINYEMRLSELL